MSKSFIVAVMIAIFSLSSVNTFAKEVNKKVCVHNKSATGKHVRLRIESSHRKVYYSNKDQTDNSHHASGYRSIHGGGETCFNLDKNIHYFANKKIKYNIDVKDVKDCSSKKMDLSKDSFKNGQDWWHIKTYLFVHFCHSGKG